jgi:Fungal trichothecene efflux pump (TRI12)
MMFLRLRFVPKPFFEQVASMDWTGILLLSGGLVGILWAIFSGGVVFPWASGRVLAAMIFGIIGVVTFILHQAFVAGKYTKQKPIIPLRLFGTRTASIGYYIVLIHAVILSSIANYYPLYVRFPSLKSPLCHELTHSSYTSARDSQSSALPSQCYPAPPSP